MSNNKNKRVVGLTYNQDKNQAPHIIAKGEGYVAKKIIEIAQENDIPIHEDSALAQILYQLELNQEIPAELYPIVAEIFALVYQAEKMVRNNAK